MYQLRLGADPLDPSFSLRHRHSIIRLLRRRRCKWVVLPGQYNSSSLPDDDCALIEVLSLFSDQSDIFVAVICSLCALILGNCLQDLKTITLAPEHRAASKQPFACPKRCFFPKFSISDCIFGTRAFLYCGLAQNAFHFIFTSTNFAKPTLPKERRTLVEKIFVQKSTNMGGTYLLPQHVKYPSPTLRKGR